MWRAALPVLALTACGAPCPKPAPADQAVVIAPTPVPVRCPEPDGDAPPVAKVAADDAAFAGYDGRWFLMEPDGDEVEFVMEIHGTRGTLRKVGRKKSEPIRVERQPNGMALLVIPDPGGASEQVYLVPRGPHSLTAFEFGDDDALIGRREAPVPSWFRGKWELSSLRGRDPITLEFDGKQGRMERDGKMQRLDVRGLKREGAMFELTVQRVDTSREEDVAWLRISEIEPGVYLVFEGNDDDFIVMHRPGARPAWVEKASRVPPPPAVQWQPTKPPTPVKPPAPGP